MSIRHMKMDDIKARANAAFVEKQQRKDAILGALHTHDEQSKAIRLKTDNLRALRLAKEAADAASKVQVAATRMKAPASSRRSALRGR